MKPSELLEAQLRECFGRVVYSHKTHEKCADILLKRLATIKLWQIILSAATAGGFLSALFGSGDIGAGIGVVVSTVLLVLNAYTKNYDLGELAQKHRSAASDLWMIREKYLSLLTDLRADTRTYDEIVASRDELLRSLHATYTGAPSTTFEAYKKAQQALQTAEDMTFSDEELDAFLPTALHKIS
jgi:hypothetical protein